MPKKTTKVVEKWKEFVEIYINNGRNARMAYKAIYGMGMKDESADTNGWKLLSKAEVQEYFKARLRNIAENTNVTAQGLVADLQKIVETESDTQTRIEAVKQISKLLGLEQPIKIDSTNLNIEQKSKLDKNERKAVHKYIAKKFGSKA